MAEKKERKLLVSPAGVAAYSWLTKPDTKFAKKPEDARYKITLVLKKDDAAVKKFCKELASISSRDVIKDGDVAAAKKGGKEEFKGHYLIEAKSKHKPKCVDAKRNELPANVYVMSGDIVKIAVVPNEYDPGKWNLYLNAVQLIDKRSKPFDAASAFGEEEGFTAEAGAAATEETGKDGEVPSNKPTDNLDF